MKKARPFSSLVILMRVKILPKSFMNTCTMTAFKEQKHPSLLTLRPQILQKFSLDNLKPDLTVYKLMVFTIIGSLLMEKIWKKNSTSSMEYLWKSSRNPTLWACSCSQIGACKTRSCLKPASCPDIVTKAYHECTLEKIGRWEQKRVIITI